MMDVLQDALAAFNPAIVPLTLAFCAAIIIKQFATNSCLRTELHDLRMQKATAYAALDYALHHPDAYGKARDFLWFFRAFPDEIETKFPTWPAFQHRYVTDKMRAYA